MKTVFEQYETSIERENRLFEFLNIKKIEPAELVKATKIQNGLISITLGHYPKQRKGLFSSENPEPYLISKGDLDSAYNIQRKINANSGIIIKYHEINLEEELHLAGLPIDISVALLQLYKI
jgi:hypothetical protein